MRKLIAVLLFCLVPAMASAQSELPSVQITPPKIETSGITWKEVAVVAGAMAVGAVLGEAILGGLVGDAVGTVVGLVGGYFVGTHLYDELEEEEFY